MIFLRRLALLLLAPAACAAALAAAVAHAGGPATVHAVSAGQADGKLTVNVLADDVDNLGGFTFILSWDPAVLKLDDAGPGPLLSQTGRKPYCPDPAKQDGATRLDCVTIDPKASAGNPALTQVAGAAGSGAIAVLHFQVLKDGGHASLHLSKVKLVDPYGGVLASQGTDSAVALGGGSGPPMALVFGIGGAVVLAVLAAAAAFVWRRRRTQDAGAAPLAAAAHPYDQHER